MTTILQIDSSADGFSTSSSRKLSSAVVKRLIAESPDARLVRRDLALDAIPHIDEGLRGGWLADPDTRTSRQTEIVARSEGLIAELRSATVVVIGAPMYNFSVPSSLKAWIDHVLIAGQTFRYTAEGVPVGLLTGKSAILVLTRGGIYSSGPMAALDHQESYLRAVLGFIGITDLTIVRAEGLALGEDAASASLADAIDQIGRVASRPLAA